MSPRSVKLPRRLRIGKCEISSYKGKRGDTLAPFEFRLIRSEDGNEKK
jgi:hypothetical protein